MTKPVFFDGDRFLTKQAYGSLQARQIPHAVNSAASGMPLLGRIGDRIAQREVYRRMPTSDAIVVRQVADDVLPKINTRVDGQLAELNRKWQNLRRTIARVSGDQKILWAAGTTGNSFSLSASSPRAKPRAAEHGASLTTDLQNNEAVVLMVSQDSINRWLNDQPLGGLTIPDAALQQAALTVQNAKDDPRALLELLKWPSKASVEPLIFSLKLADSVPIAVAFEDGLLTLNIRFQVVPKMAAPAQMHQLSLSLGGQDTTDGKWAIALRQVAVEPADSSAVSDAWTKLIDDQVTKIIKGVPPTELPRLVDLRHIDKRIPPVRIHRVQSETGQLRLSFNLNSATEKITTRRFVR